MTPACRDFVGRELAAVVQGEVTAAARAIKHRLPGTVAVLFYGSVLRTGDMEGVLDFYVLTAAAAGRGLRALGTRWLWPDVSFHEITFGQRTIRAKVATMPLRTFEAAAGGRLLDTTIWTRFVQPSALIWVADPVTAARVTDAVATAAITAARFAAAVGPATGSADQYWKALFEETYRIELRVEPPGREDQILDHNPARYAALLPIAWEAGGVAFRREESNLEPCMTFDDCRRTIQALLLRLSTGKLLNIARLMKAAFTFDGAARYGLWKIERHTGISIALTAWRERHPILAAPGVLWYVIRATRK